MLVAFAMAGCLPDTSDFSFGDRDGGTDDAGSRDFGVDLFVPQDCRDDVECTEPFTECQRMQGQCVEGSCAYEERGSGPCDDGDRCTMDDVCTATGCQGAAVACVPPEPRCVAGDLVTTSGGRCEPADGCVFDEATTPCEHGCSAGACEDEVCTPMAWTITDVPEPTVDFRSDLDHVVDAAGGDHVSYVSDDGVRYLHRALGGPWMDELVEPIMAGTPQKETAIALDGAGVPHIVFARWNDEVILAERAGSGWSTESLGSGGVPGVAFDSGGSVHVVYQNSGLRHAVRASGATDFTTTPIRRSDGGFTRAAHADALVLMSDAVGVVHLVFNDFAEDVLSYARSDTDWAIEDVHSALVLPGAFDATLDASAGVHVAFSDDATRNLRYAHRPPAGSWSTLLVHDALNPVGDPCAIAVSPAGAVHIGYRDEGRRQLRHAEQTVSGGSFTHELVDSDNGFPVGAHADDAGRVRLVYIGIPPVGDDILRLAERRTCP